MIQLIEAKDINTLFWCLDNFTDIPEDHLVRMIQLALKDTDGDIFRRDMGEDEEDSKPDLKTVFLNKVLSVPVDSTRLLKYLRQVLDFEDCLNLINYLSGLFSDVEKEDISVDRSTVILEWTMTLLDAFYQHFILSRDPKVLELIAGMKKTVDELVNDLKKLSNILPSIIGLKKGKVVEKRHCGSYSVERFRLYS